MGNITGKMPHQDRWGSKYMISKICKWFKKPEPKRHDWYVDVYLQTTKYRNELSQLTEDMAFDRYMDLQAEMRYREIRDSEPIVVGDKKYCGAGIWIIKPIRYCIYDAETAKYHGFDYHKEIVNRLDKLLEKDPVQFF